MPMGLDRRIYEEVIRFKNEDEIGDPWRAISTEVAPALKQAIARIRSRIGKPALRTRCRSPGN